MRGIFGGDLGQVIAVAFNLGIQIQVVLECVEVDIPIGQRIVGQRKVGELHQLHFNSLALQRFNGGRPDLLMNSAGNADGHMDRLAGVAAGLAVVIGRGAVAALRAAGSQSQRKKCGGQYKCNRFIPFHFQVPPIISRFKKSVMFCVGYCVPCFCLSDAELVISAHVPAKPAFG